MGTFKTLELAMELHRRLQTFHMQAFHKDQLQRASLSIALNLAEGAGRFSKNDKRRFYRIAYGSLKETQTLISLTNITDPKVLELSDKTGASIYKLILALNNR